MVCKGARSLGGGRQGALGHVRILRTDCVCIHTHFIYSTHVKNKDTQTGGHIRAPSWTHTHTDGRMRAPDACARRDYFPTLARSCLHRRAAFLAPMALTSIACMQKRVTTRMRACTRGSGFGRRVQVLGFGVWGLGFGVTTRRRAWRRKAGGKQYGFRV